MVRTLGTVVSRDTKIRHKKSGNTGQIVGTTWGGYVVKCEDSAYRKLPFILVEDWEIVEEG